MSHENAANSSPRPQAILGSGTGALPDATLTRAEADARMLAEIDADIAAEKAARRPAIAAPPARLRFRFAHHAADGTADPRGIVVMTTDDERKMGKHVDPDKGTTSAAANGFTYDAQEVIVENLSRLLALLRNISPSWRKIVVRGTLIGGPDQKGILRRRVSQPHVPATIRDAARYWLGLDAEKVPLPDGVDILDVPACARVVISRLPQEFHGVACIAQASSGHGIKRGEDGRYEIRLHLWFWLSRPVHGLEARGWLAGCDCVDGSVFWPEHILYTANPTFPEGTPDPIAERFVIVPGDRGVVSVPTKIDWEPARQDHGPLVAIGTPGKPPEPTIPLDVLREAVAVILGEGTTNREEWRNTGFALAYETGGSEEGWRVYRELTLAHPRCGTQPGEEAAAADIWQRGQIPHPRPCTIGTILKVARKVKGDRGWLPAGWKREYDRRLPDGSEFATDTAAAGPEGGTVGKADTAENALVLSRGTPLESAREFLRRHYQHDLRRTLHHYRGEWFEWSGSRYVRQEPLAIKRRVYRFLDESRVWIKAEDGKFKPGPFNPKPKDVREILDALQSDVLLPEETVVPAWLDRKEHPPAKEFFAVANGLLHIPTGELRPHDPAFFGFNAVDYPYDANAPEPKEWPRFLRSLWPDREDDDAIDGLHEMMGYYLANDTSLQKLFLMIGPPRSGKGTIGRMIKGLLGEENVAGPTLSGLTKDFGLQGLIGKPLAIVADARLGGRTDPTPIIERLLSISGEDTLSIGRKYLPDWVGKLPTRVLMLTNELPALVDSSGALAGRYVIWQLTEDFYGREDHALLDRLLPERTAILNLALAGWRRLKERGRFTMPRCAADTVALLRAASSPVLAFLAECTAACQGGQVMPDDLFAAWRGWCDRDGRRSPGTRTWFGRALHAARPDLAKKDRPRGGDDPSRPRFYKGISLTAAGWEAAEIFSAHDAPPDGKGVLP